ncbi:MAG: hypothetical protein ACREXR_16610 [Gammaproteobacteria bacterium]
MVAATQAASEKTIHLVILNPPFPEFPDDSSILLPSSRRYGGITSVRW